jgi:hypothetical protein
LSLCAGQLPRLRCKRDRVGVHRVRHCEVSSVCVRVGPARAWSSVVRDRPTVCVCAGSLHRPGRVPPPLPPPRACVGGRARGYGCTLACHVFFLSCVVSNMLYSDPGASFEESCGASLNFTAWQALGQDAGSSVAVTPRWVCCWHRGWLWAKSALASPWPRAGTMAFTPTPTPPPPSTPARALLAVVHTTAVVETSLPSFFCHPFPPTLLRLVAPFAVEQCSQPYCAWCIRTGPGLSLKPCTHWQGNDGWPPGLSHPIPPPPPRRARIRSSCVFFMFKSGKANRAIASMPLGALCYRPALNAFCQRLAKHHKCSDGGRRRRYKVNVNSSRNAMVSIWPSASKLSGAQYCASKGSGGRGREARRNTSVWQNTQERLEKGQGIRGLHMAVVLG